MTDSIHIRIEGGAGRITLDRPRALNALTWDMIRAIETALDDWHDNLNIDLLLIDAIGEKAFCSGGDQRIRGKDGYKYAEGTTADTIEPGRAGRLHILECQRLIRFMPKVVICVVPGWAAGGRRGRGAPW